jgi:HupE / UreJ protein
MRLLAFLLAVLFLGGEAHAHQTSLSYINVISENGAVTANMKLSFLDLEAAAGIDQDFDGKVRWGEARASLDRVSAYVQSKTAMTAGGTCRLARASAAPEALNGEGYLVLRFSVTCPDMTVPVEVASSIFLEIDPTSRVLVSSRMGDEASSYVLGVDQRRAPTAGPEQKAGVANFPLLSYFHEGVAHLFGGPDHMLFLLVLVIPAICQSGGLGSVGAGVLLPITGFTLGHALTLTSAASGLVRPPSQIVEILIAATILLTAIDNVKPFVPGPRSVVAFVFGLVHGFGFASALGALDVAGWQMAVALLGFNLGIEAGQAMLALAIAPLSFAARRPAMRFGLMPLGMSVLAGAMAIYWIVERMVGA